MAKKKANAPEKTDAPAKMDPPGQAGAYSALAAVIVSILTASLSPIVMAKYDITEQQCNGIIGGLVMLAFVLMGYVFHNRLEIHRVNVNNDNVNALNSQTAEIIEKTKK